MRPPFLIDALQCFKKIFSIKSKLELSLKEARGAVRLEPEKAHGHAMLGSILFSLKKNSEAIKELNTAIALKPADRIYRSRRAAIYEQEKLFQQAANDLTVAINNT